MACLEFVHCGLKGANQKPSLLARSHCQHHRWVTPCLQMQSTLRLGEIYCNSSCKPKLRKSNKILSTIILKLHYRELSITINYELESNKYKSLQTYPTALPWRLATISSPWTRILQDGQLCLYKPWMNVIETKVLYKFIHLLSNFHFPPIGLKHIQGLL